MIFIRTADLIVNMKKFLALLLLSPLVVSEAFNIQNSLHGLRHTHASNLLMSDYPTIQLAHRLGHADAKITMGIYAHYIPETAVDIHQYMPDIDISNGNNS